MTFGEQIRMYREKAGMSQADLAKKLGYKSRATIHKIENGINGISVEKFTKLIKVLGIHDINALLHA